MSDQTRTPEDVVRDAEARDATVNVTNVAQELFVHPRPMIGGYGAYAALADVVKIEPVQAGKNWRIVAWLRGVPGDHIQMRVLRLTEDLDTEAEAMRECDRIAAELFGVVGDPAVWPPTLRDL